MAAGDGIPRVTAALETMAQASERLNSSLDAVSTNWENATTALGGFSASMMALSDIQKEIASGAQQAAAGTGGGNKAYDTAIADKLAALQGQIAAVAPGGDQNFFAQTIATFIPRLRAGTISPQDAIQSIQGLLGPFISGLMQELADPNTSPAMRALDLELERFLQGGQLPQQ
jgi:uncharacterized phage infection (PIP) family protein YhgE